MRSHPLSFHLSGPTIPEAWDCELWSFLSKSNLASLVVSGRWCNYSDTPQSWTCQKIWLEHQTISLSERDNRRLLCVRTVARLGDFSPGCITLHCWAISIVKGKCSAMSSLLAHTKALLSSRKENEESDSALVSLIWLKGKSTFDFNWWTTMPVFFRVKKVNLMCWK